MLDGTVDSAVKVYQAAGWLGVLVFFVALLVLGMITLLARTAKRHASEADVARQQIQDMHKRMLEECMREHSAKDQRISLMEARERELAQLIESLRIRVATLEALVTTEIRR